MALWLLALVAAALPPGRCQTKAAQEADAGAGAEPVFVAQSYNPDECSADTHHWACTAIDSASLPKTVADARVSGGTLIADTAMSVTEAVGDSGATHKCIVGWDVDGELVFRQRCEVAGMYPCCIEGQAEKHEQSEQSSCEHDCGLQARQEIYQTCVDAGTDGLECRTKAAGWADECKAACGSRAGEAEGDAETDACFQRFGTDEDACKAGIERRGGGCKWDGRACVATSEVVVEQVPEDTDESETDACYERFKYDEEACKAAAERNGVCEWAKIVHASFGMTMNNEDQTLYTESLAPVVALLAVLQ